MNMLLHLIRKYIKERTPISQNYYYLICFKCGVGGVFVNKEI